MPAPYSNPANIDPEEAFVASLSSCHMLTFLHVARQAGFQVDSYEDEAVGEMAKNERGVAWVAVVTLNPKIVYAGDKRPTHGAGSRAAPQGARRLLHLPVGQDRGEGRGLRVTCEFAIV